MKVSRRPIGHFLSTRSRTEICRQRSPFADKDNIGGCDTHPHPPVATPLVLISGLLHYDATRSEQDNVATPVTAMMVTVCISTDIRPDTELMPSDCSSNDRLRGNARDLCVNPRSRSCSANCSSINSRVCLLAIEIRVDDLFPLRTKKQFKLEQKQRKNMQESQTASRKKTTTQRERYVQLCDKLKFMKVQMHATVIFTRNA